MTGLDRYGQVMAPVIGGFVAGYSIRESLGLDLFHIESSGKWYGAFVTAQWAGSLAVVAAMIVLAVVHSRRSSVLAAVAAALGAVVIALPSFAPIASNQAVTTNAVGAGVLVGVCGHIAAGRRIPSAALAVGLLGSMLFYNAISPLRAPREGRWMDNLAPQYVESTVPLLLLLGTAVLLTVVALRAPAIGFEASDAVVAGVLAFVYLIVYTYLGNTTSTLTMWIFAVSIAVALTYAVALNLDGRDGRYLMLGLAIAASGVNSLGWSDASWWVFAVAAVLFVGAVWAGLHRDLSTPALVLLAVVTATGLLAIDDSAVNVVGTVAHCTLCPVALGLAVGSMQPRRAVASSIGPLIPFALTLFWVSAPVPPREFGWTDGTPDDYVRPIVSLYSPLPVGVVAAVIVVLACIFAPRGDRRDHHDRVSESSGP
ncbi:MAG: hypothetical protein U5N21_16980 [Rhodococcus sp. (in: high G+C Gram-positive bacteria)]|uniref:hypothetical protein n=1 Tax=Rhodococcus sp. TaxID=1831 RepID=UPI002ADBEACC|nr:hypothetical protein [Rhodococcus sp. (in: high G+C Gram-positive bacteria)]MDZ7931643.1 hypothetical protein [Rhodococcus sp. (in: high G+C Gram-positive bacteria)]